MGAAILLSAEPAKRDALETSPRAINDYSLAGSNHGLGTTDINSGAGNPASPGSFADPLPIIRQAHMSSRSSLLGCPVRFSPSPKPRLSIVSRWE